jgi:hypothetical protein
MFTRTGQPGLWFIAGSLAQCRIYSKYLALQIKACEVGLLPRIRAPREGARSGAEPCLAADAPDAAKALVRFLTAPEAGPIIRKTGMEPG